jgi:glycosyltransferase involved in cell wall biosynthesis
MTGAQLRAAIMRGDHPRRSIRNYLIHAPLHGYHGIMALSQHEKEVLVGLHVPAERITVVPNAVELQQYIDAPSHPRHAQPTILFIGQLVPRKGWDLAVRALPLIAASIPDIRMVMVTHNTSQQSEFEALANSLGVTARITLLTSVDEAQKIQLLHSAHLLLAPSRYEGFGIPPIEAMAAHCPVVTTDCAAGNEIVTAMGGCYRSVGAQSTPIGQRAVSMMTEGRAPSGGWRWFGEPIDPRDCVPPEGR